MPKITNVEVYGLKESFKASKYPMSIDTDSCTYDYTPRIESLGMSPVGEAHDNYLNGIIVQFDLTFSCKAWVEAERYHFLDFVSSQSTMHRITRMEVKKQCNEYVDDRFIEILQEKIDTYLADDTLENFLKVIYNIPSGFELTARMTTNYRQLKTIYKQRKNHRLIDWKEFCKFIKTLPYSHLITGEKEN